MKKLIMATVMLTLVWACSKDEVTVDSDYANKSTLDAITNDPEEVLTLVQDFIGNVDDL